ncbi:hypothetical protein JTB14_027072 [Gonioctena quinquepunctata]|nr:hypothetical protein JTB14_027072 [Gonioctena quinquepunctata]
MNEETGKKVPPDIDKSGGTEIWQESQGNAPLAMNGETSQESKSEQVHTSVEFQLGKNNATSDFDNKKSNELQEEQQSEHVEVVIYKYGKNDGNAKKQDGAGSPGTPLIFQDCNSTWDYIQETPQKMPIAQFHIGASSQPESIQQLKDAGKSVILIVPNIEDDEILTLEISNVEHPPGPFEVEKTAGEGDTVHTITSRNSTNTRGENQANNMKFSDSSLYSPASNTENDSFNKSMPTGSRPMRRSSRIVVADGEGKWKRKRMSPVEANEKSTKRQTRLETQVKSRIERCDCGEIAPKHGFYTKFDDYTINVKCIGSRSRTELSAGYKLTSVAQNLKARNAYNIEKFESDYEKEKEKKMKTNQSQEGKEEKAKAKEDARTKGKSGFGNEDEES